jgi:hypothetical protein
VRDPTRGAPRGAAGNSWCPTRRQRAHVQHIHILRAAAAPRIPRSSPRSRGPKNANSDSSRVKHWKLQVMTQCAKTLEEEDHVSKSRLGSATYYGRAWAFVSWFEGESSGESEMPAVHLDQRERAEGAPTILRRLAIHVPKQPLAEERLENEPHFPAVGGMAFSAAHLHQIVPDTTTRMGLSIDFRSPGPDDSVTEREGGRSRRTARDPLLATSLARATSGQSRRK